MEKIKDNISEKPSLILNLLENLSVTEDEMIKLEDSLQEQARQAFQKWDQELKMITTAIHKLSSEDLEELYRLATDQNNERNYLVGVHKIKNALRILMDYSNDPKYKSISKKG